MIALAADPSVLVQVVPPQHKFNEAWQYIPLKELQADIPHAQSTVFAAEPSTFVQASPFEHEIAAAEDEATQYKPDDRVHMTPCVELPQMHAAVLGVPPALWVHDGPAKQIQ